MSFSGETSAATVVTSNVSPFTLLVFSVSQSIKENRTESNTSAWG